MAFRSEQGAYRLEECFLAPGATCKLLCCLKHGDWCECTPAFGGFPPVEEFDVASLPPAAPAPQKAAFHVHTLYRLPFGTCPRALGICEAVAAWAFAGDLAAADAAASAAEWRGCAAAHQSLQQLSKEARERHSGALNDHSVWSCCGAGAAEVCAGGKVPHQGSLEQVPITAVTQSLWTTCGSCSRSEADRCDNSIPCCCRKEVIEVAPACVRGVWSCCPLATEADFCRRTPPLAALQGGGGGASAGAAGGSQLH